jgi:1-acyl-sn-glycerol-3-phosphate acyltransferase
MRLIRAADDPAKYRSTLKASVRFVGQDILLKRAIWTYCDISVHGRDLLENVDEPFIVISNHSSHLDASLILGSLPRRLRKHIATGAAADYFFDKKLKGATTSLFFNAYPVERKGGSRTHKGLTGRLLDAGIPLLVFPEGTRSRNGALGTFKPGVAALAISRKVPVIPLALVGAYAAWPYYRAVPPSFRPEIHVVIGHPLTALPGESAVAFAERMQKCVAELYNTTAKAYGMLTLDDYARDLAWKKAEEEAERARHEAEEEALMQATTPEEAPEPVAADTQSEETVSESDTRLRRILRRFTKNSGAA